jgi:SSS family solute:Na+ symporter
MNNTPLFVIIVYFVLLVFMGLLIRRNVSTFEQYALAGRKIRSFYLSFSMLATFIGGGTLVALTGRIVNTGISNYWIFAFAGLSFILMGYWGRKLRDKKKFSLPEVIEESFGERNKYLIAFIVIVAVSCFMGVQLKTAAIVMSNITNISEDYAIILMCGIVILYTFFGGLLADIYTDALQLIIIIIALILSSFYIYNTIGGFQTLKGILSQVSVYGPNKYFAVFGQGTNIISTIMLFFGTLMLVGLTIFTDPALHQRIYAAKNTNTVKWAGLFAGIIYIVLGLLIVFIAIEGHVVLDAEVGGEYIFPRLASEFLPPILGGLLLAALLSAAMSTLDSDFLLLSTILVNDYYHKKLNPNAKDKELLYLSRMLIVFFGIFSLLVALVSPTVLDLLQATWILLVASIAVPIFCIIFNKGNDLGATLSILGGFISALFVLIIFRDDAVKYFLICVLISALGMVIGVNIHKHLQRKSDKYV